MVCPLFFGTCNDQGRGKLGPYHIRTTFEGAEIALTHVEYESMSVSKYCKVRCRLL